MNAAHRATVILERYAPALLISLGVGGAYPETGLDKGDIAVADREIYADEGVLMKDGFHSMDEIGIPFLKRGKKEYFNEFTISGQLVKKACSLIAPPMSEKGRQCKRGTFLTVSTATGRGERAHELMRRHDPLCENMEGAAVVHVCTMYRIPVLEIRGISNRVEERDKKRWDLAGAAKNCQEAVILFLKGL